MVVPSYHYMIGPAVALLAMVVIVLLCRWVFSTSTRDDRAARQRAREAVRGDYGLLVPVATTRSVDDATMLRTVLQDAGIRATVTTGDTPQSWQLLVFRGDASRASHLVRS